MVHFNIEHYFIIVKLKAIISINLYSLRYFITNSDIIIF
jgi:hypothetical protein